MYSFIKEATAKAVIELFGLQIAPNQVQINDTPEEFQGDCTIVLFPFLKASKMPPTQTGEALAKALISAGVAINAYNIVKGFLNLELADAYWFEQFGVALINQSFGTFAPTGRKIMVEYSSPNTNKPLHLGHIRNNLLGYSIAEILKANGHQVIKTNLVNDRGVHICKSMLAWQKFGKGETPESSGLKGDHLVGKYYVEFDKANKAQAKELVATGMAEEDAPKQTPLMKEVQAMLLKWEAGDEEVIALWKKMNQWCYDGFAITYQKMGVDFDIIYYESETYLTGKKMVQEGLSSGLFQMDEKNGSVFIDLTQDGLDRKVLQRGDGTSLYMTQDMGTAQLRYDKYKMDELIYVVGNEQDYHFKVLQTILKKMGKVYANGIYHMSYGMVELPDGKMKSREGTVVDADDLMDEMVQEAKQKSVEAGKALNLSMEEQTKLNNLVGMGALKFFLLKVDPKKKMLFNPAESIDMHGFTGPFIQYAYARMQSIIRKYNDENGLNSLPLATYQFNAEEKKLVRLALQYPSIIKEAALNHSPAVVANYSYALAKAFNHFYAEVSILKSSGDQLHFRIQLLQLISRVLKKSLNLLGIEAPERM